MQRIAPFVARWVWRDGRWSTQFAPVQRARPPAKDVQPLTFTGNKLIVLDPVHPLVSAAVQRDFSPLSYVDTLVGIELAESTAYFARFETAGGPDLARAAHIYRESCGFCHGLAGVGARMGPDLVEPVPAPDYLGRRAFFLHLRFRATDAPSRGLVMPAFSDLDERDAQLVRRWLWRIAQRGTARYAPRAP